MTAGPAIDMATLAEKAKGSPEAGARARRIGTLQTRIRKYERRLAEAHAGLHAAQRDVDECNEDLAVLHAELAELQGGGEVAGG